MTYGQGPRFQLEDMPPTDGHTEQSPPSDPQLRLVLDQFEEDCHPHSKAVESYNTHLENHRDRRDLHALPRREEIVDHDAFTAARHGDPAAIDTLVAHLIDQTHLDSQVRRHTRTYPIHMEAVEQLELARERLVTTLETALQIIGDDA